MRKISLALAFVASLLAIPAQAANFSGKDAAAATIIFNNPGNCTTGCTPIFAWSDSTGTNLVAVLTAGADGASNTANGGLTYGRNLVFNGTTWDRWLGDATNGGFVNVKTSVLPTGAGTSANQTTINTSIGTTNTNLGAPGATACASDTASCSVNQLMQRVAQNLTTLNSTAGAAVATGTNTIGNTGSDPSSGKATPTSTFLALPATATTQIIALSGATKTYVTSYRFMAGGTVNVTFKYGTGSNCGTGTTTLEGPWPLTAQAGMTAGSGLGAIMIVPASQALCVTTDASVTGGVALSYQQF